MSTIWTPGGEYTPRGDTAAEQRRPPAESRRDPVMSDPITDDELAAEAERVREQILATPVVDVVANHAIGLFEVAALHLGAEPPKLSEAQLAIDAMAALVEGLGSRMGRHEPVVRDALSQLQMAFVQTKTQTQAS